MGALLAAHSILIPFSPRRPEQVLPYAALVYWSNAERLWQGQSLLVEPHQAFSYAAGAGFRIPVGSGVTLMPFRHPYEAALQARSLAMTTGHPVIAGFGPGGRALQEALLGAPYRSQLGAVREYVTIVRSLLSGEPTAVTGEYFSCHGQMAPHPHADVRIGLGVLRPAMAELAGETADAAITWLTPAPYVRDTLIPALRAGAERAGRKMPKVTAIVPMAVSRTDCEPAELALAGNSGHLRLPHYIDMLRRAGVDVAGSDPTTAAEALVKIGAFLSGDAGQLAERLREYSDAGVDEIVLNLTGVYQKCGPEAALSDIKTILAEVA